MPARGHALPRPPSNARVTAGRAARVGILAAGFATALSALWAFSALAPAFRSAAERAVARPASESFPVEGALSEPLASGVLDRRFDPAVLRWESQILGWSRSFDLDPVLIATVMQIESCGNPYALSPAGALGLFQVMPYHFEAADDPYDPKTNARRGLSYLKSALELSSGDAALALAGYNGGHGQISRPVSFWPPETQRYVAWGTGLISDLKQATGTSPTLQAWMEAGGASLCRRAAEVRLTHPSRQGS